ncbi:hypothetical protein C8R47DRAFT_517233 [Mycena vitilis]|nr:hypothetical protein C8R47DRAFT_517233 [Mycena vitilis]
MKSVKRKVDKVMQRFSKTPPNVPLQPPAVRQVITGAPVLPPELEREIFELVAVDDLLPNPLMRQHIGNTTMALPQVCRRVQGWIEPMIYQHISFLWSSNDRNTVPRFLATISARPASFFATHVKLLYFDYSVTLSAVQQILGVCTGVVSLGCHYRYSALEHLLAPLPIQHLLLSDLPLPSAPGNLPPWAASLTHLGLADTLPLDPTVLSTLPSLTHLAVGYMTLPNPEWPGMGAALEGLLHACSCLRCLVLMTESQSGYNWAVQRLRTDGFSDSRFYMHLRPDSDETWDAWAHAGCVCGCGGTV